MITQEFLKEVLNYNQYTGEFRWAKDIGKNVKAGVLAGTDHYGYIAIIIRKKKYRAHRLAFLYMTGSFPVNQVDHINRNRSDNRWINLRDVTQEINMRNCNLSKANTSGFAGVSFHKGTGKFMAKIKVNNKAKYLGYFENAQEAYSAYLKAKSIYHHQPLQGS